MRENLHKIGRYEVTGELGRGSMGIVHLAHDPVMGRDVAIKTVLIPHGLPDAERDEYCKRFQREAQAAGRLSHRGIVTIYEFDEEPGPERPFIAMELVEGPTLHELICSDGALNPEWVLGMGGTLADALFAAHNAGIIHRDLKPANILIRESDGAAKIADFGVARVNMSELTEATTTYGSPAYMAPERIRSIKADARSDLFSLAVILYEALCGERPFGGDDFTANCYAIVNDEPASICERASDLVPGFDTFFSRALAKDPDARFPNGTEFREALEAIGRAQRAFQGDAGTMKMSLEELSRGVATSDAPASTMRLDVGTLAAETPAGTPVDTNDETTIREQPLDLLEDRLDAFVEDTEPAKTVGPDPHVSSDPTLEGNEVDRVLAQLDGDLPSTEEGPPFLATALPELADSDLEPFNPLELDEVGNSSERSPLPVRWIVIGSSLVLLLLFSFAGGWLLRGTTPVNLEPVGHGRALPVMEAAPVGDAVPVLEPIAPAETTADLLADASLTASFREALQTSALSPRADPSIPQIDALPTVDPGPVPVPAAAKPKAKTVRAASSVAPPATVPSTSAKQPVAQPVETAASDTLPAVTAEISAPEAPTPAAVAANTAVLDVQVRSSIKAGQLTLTVDGTEVYSADLESETKRWARMLKKAKRQAAQDLETRVELPPGKHMIAVKITGGEGSKSRDAELEVHVVPGDTRTLRIVAGGTFGRKLTMKLE